MFELLILVLFIWLTVKAVGLGLTVAWGVTKVIASLLLAIAIPTLFGCLLFAGGVVLLLPIALLSAALGLLKLGR